MEPGKRFANLEHICFQPFQAFYKHKMFFAALLLGEGRGALGIASCPEWCSSCCTGIFQHTWIATAEFIAFPGREGGWEDCQWVESVFYQKHKDLTHPLCILQPWATFNCNYPVLIWPFWAKGQCMNTSHFLKLLCTFILPVCQWKETEMRSFMLPRGLGKVQTPPSLCCSPFSMPEISGIVPAGAEPEIKYSSVFLSIMQAVWCWKGRRTVGSRRGKMPTSAKRFGMEIQRDGTSKCSTSLYTS